MLHYGEVPSAVIYPEGEERMTTFGDKEKKGTIDITEGVLGYSKLAANAKHKSKEKIMLLNLTASAIVLTGINKAPKFLEDDQKRYFFRLYKFVMCHQKG